MKFRTIQSIFFLVCAVLITLSAASCATLKNIGPLFGSPLGANASEEEATPTPIPTPVIPSKPTYLVQKGEVVKQLQFNGRIAPVIQKDLVFTNNGRVDHIYFRKGDLVPKGAVIADLESDVSVFALRRAEIYLEMAKISLETTKQEMPSYSRNYDTAIRLKELDVELAQIALDELKNRITSSYITATITGTIMTLSIEEGSMVEAYKGVLLLADLSRLEISADLSNTDMAKLNEGMDVLVSAVGRPGDPMTGTLRRLPYPYGTAKNVSKEEKEDQSTRISVSFDLTEEGFELGDLAQVTVFLERKTDALWLPPQVIRSFEGRKFVVVQDENGQRRVDVKVGIVGDDRVEIVEGLTEGQVIIAP